MRQNILLGNLPTSVEISGVSYDVNYSFRAGIMIESYLFDSEMSDEQKMLKILSLFYMENIPNNVEEAIKKMMEFQFYHFQKNEESEQNGAARKKKQKRAYDFEQDANYIFSAYLTQYKINLNQIKDEELHWWEFLAMLQCLNDDLLFSKIMYWRLADTAGMSKEEKKFIDEMKQKYAIKDKMVPDKKISVAEQDKRTKNYFIKRIEELQKKKGLEK